MTEISCNADDAMRIASKLTLGGDYAVYFQQRFVEGGDDFQ